MFLKMFLELLARIVSEKFDDAYLFLIENSRQSG